MKTKNTAVETLTVGLDLGDRRHHACILDASGEILAEEAIVNTREVLTAFCARYPGAMAFARKVREQLAPADAALVAPLLAAIDTLNAQVKALDIELEALAHERYPATERLRQIPGVGQITALCFVLTLESHEHFGTRAPSGRIWAWCRAAINRARATSSWASPRRATCSCAAS